jgi:hypothetical protein
MHSNDEGRLPGRPSSILMVTPAFKRFELAEICFDQRKLVHEALAKQGIEANTVVIANDENLEVARANGFLTVEAPNYELGRKFNDGHEVAGKEGFTYSLPIGSDSWVDPALLSWKIKDAETNPYKAIVVSRNLAAMSGDGHTWANLTITWGVGQMLPVDALKPLNYRPCEDDLPRGCDTATRRNFLSTGLRVGVRKLESLHDYELVNFQSGRTQVTAFDGYVNYPKAKVTRGEPADLLQPLRDYYPDSLVDRVLDYYESGHSLTA